MSIGSPRDVHAGCVYMQTALVPGPEIGTDVGALGLFAPGKSVAAGQAFGWELIMTFILVCSPNLSLLPCCIEMCYCSMQVLSCIHSACGGACCCHALVLMQSCRVKLENSAQVSTVYSVAIGTPSFGDVGPLIIGLSVFSCATSGKGFYPRALGPNGGPHVRLQQWLLIWHVMCCSWLPDGCWAQPCTSAGPCHRLQHWLVLCEYPAAVKSRHRTSPVLRMRATMAEDLNSPTMHHVHATCPIQAARPTALESKPS